MTAPDAFCTTVSQCKTHMVSVHQVKADDVTPPLSPFNHMFGRRLQCYELHCFTLLSPILVAMVSFPALILHDPDIPFDPPLGCIDGHAGSGAATFLEQNLLPTVLSGLTPGADINTAMCTAYLDCNAALEASGCQHGSTATTVSHPRPGSHPLAAAGAVSTMYVMLVHLRMENAQGGQNPLCPVSR